MITRLLRSILKRETLITLYNFYTLLLKTLRSLFANSKPTMSQSNDSLSQTSTFDPFQPSIPISYPIKTLEDLASRSYFDSFHYQFNKSSVPLPPTSISMPNRPRLLVCHDMQGGYGLDKWIQGGNDPNAFAIRHWYLIDVFVYFSHYLVTLPPPCWTNAAHRHGVKVLGTFITEWDEGKIICNKLLATKDHARTYAERLAELAADLGFDGWLINLENGLLFDQIPNLKEFISHLTQKMHAMVPGSLVIWYDSVTTEGHLRWQDKLNELNKPFFDLCDGIFVNYTWKETYPKHSVAEAGDRKFDVYMGIDVFGRNTYGGGQWNTNVALDVLKENSVSAAIFAPGWTYETNQPPDHQTAQNKWWALVEKSLGRVNSYPKMLPFFSSFDKGCGYHISVEGRQVKDASWNNISCQSFQPLLEFVDGQRIDAMKVLIDLKGTSYHGGGNVTFGGALDEDDYSMIKLFQADLLCGTSPLDVTYSIKSDGYLVLGLSLHFSSTVNERTSVLIAPWEEASQFCSNFGKVIEPHQVRNDEHAPGWVVYEGCLEMNGYTLTEIHAVCCRQKSKHGKSISEHEADGQVVKLQGPEKLFAVLGHITIKNREQSPDFPHSTSWLVKGEHKRIDSAHGLKTVSLLITWKLKDGSNIQFASYNIYVHKWTELSDAAPGKGFDSTPDYLGVAHVKAFYVSDISVPSDISGLKFIIQASGDDGTYQKLEESPFLELHI